MHIIIDGRKYEYRIYDKKNTITFAKVHEPFGELHNMAPNFPIQLNGENIFTSEHLYQAMRFPFHSDIQREILKPKSPMKAKMIAKEYIQYTRPDWESVNIKIMKWCITMKLINNFDSFSQILLSTETKNIVEYSTKSSFWGSKYENGVLTGVNALGRLLMELRENLPKIQQGQYVLQVPVNNFIFLDAPINDISFI